MSVIKGYPSKKQLSQGSVSQDLFVTVEPVKQNQNAISVLAHAWVQEIASDTVEAASTINSIVATAHVAKAGDFVLFTSGVLIKTEVKVARVDANNIYLVEDLDSVPSAGVTFDILRHKSPKVTADGDLTVSIASSGVTAFDRNGVVTNVTEDTVTPANNRPLPVKLMGVNGSLSVTTDVLDISSTFATDSMDVSGSTVTADLSVPDKTLLSNIEDNTTLINSSLNRTVINTTYKDMSVTGITAAAYVELFASTSAIGHKVQIFDGFGTPMIIAIGNAGSEVPIFHMPPGGTEIEMTISAGQRISVKSLSGTANSGFLIINIIG